MMARNWRKMVALVRSSTGAAVRKPMPREMVWKKGNPCTKKKSAQRVTFRWCSKMGGGIGVATNVAARGAAADRVVFPMMTAMSGP